MNLDDIAKSVKLMMDTGYIEEWPRPYLGMSQMGHECSRNLWMYFRWAAKVKYKKRSKRIFERGDIEEQRILQRWREAGFNPTDSQKELVGVLGHLRGHTDGIVSNIPGLEDKRIVGEIKSMARKYFTPLTKKGVEKSKPGYYVQAQLYMHFEEAEYCLHHTTNKDDEDFYIEIIEYSEPTARLYVDKAYDIITSDVPPKKVSNDPTYWQCQWCDFYGPCQLEDKFLRTCRTCQYAKILPEGEWYCNEHDKFLTKQMQREACPKYDSLKV